MIKQTNNPEQTKKYGAEFAQQLQGGEVVLLVGEIGAGKTTFVQGIGSELNVPDHIKSPTFVIVHEHQVNNQKTIKHLIHLDGYRLGQTRLSELGIDRFCGRIDTVIVIEWPDQVEFDLEDCQATHRIEFKHMDKDQRKITLQQL
ncbi:MAG: tRNA (adenosine(37)-N6)-threonylcarbamoyltransferase complex ATPase subunit type 1 TsaE [Candidatus Uhrbacteria bacterium]